MAGICRAMVVAVPLLALAAAGRLAASGTERPRLYGLKKIAVAVATDADADFDRQQLQAAVESKLRGAGIKVDRGSRSRLTVVIGVAPIRSEAGGNLGFAYSIHLGLTQPVYLAHNPNRLTEAVTWQTMSLGTAPAAELAGRCAQIISRELDGFVSVYRAAAEN